MHQGHGFDPQSGFMQESTNECINRWNNKSISLCLSHPLCKNQSVKKLLKVQEARVQDQGPTLVSNRASRVWPVQLQIEGLPESDPNYPQSTAE